MILAEVRYRYFGWYESDFGSRKQLLAHLKNYANPATLRKLDKYNGVIDYQYDWKLNELK